MENKKKVGEWFEQDIETWDLSTCWKFLRLSETVQRKLPSFKTAGESKGAVLKHLEALVEAKKDVTETQDSDLHEIVELLNVCLHVMKKSLIPELASVGPLTTRHIKQDVRTIHQHIEHYLHAAELG